MANSMQASASKCRASSRCVASSTVPAIIASVKASAARSDASKASEWPYRKFGHLSFGDLGVFCHSTMLMPFIERVAYLRGSQNHQLAQRTRGLAVKADLLLGDFRSFICR
jgi:hypothetical protein